MNNNKVKNSSIDLKNEKIITVEVLCWEEFTGEKTLSMGRHNTWFKIRNNHIRSSRVQPIPHFVYRVLLYLLCFVSDEANLTITFSIQLGSISTNCKKKSQFIQALEFLSAQDMIAITSPRLDREERKERASENVSNETFETHTHQKTKKKKPDTLSKEFDDLFSECWELYPRKVNRSVSMKRFKTVLNLPEDFENFKTAIKNYSRQVDTENTEIKFIKHMSTFIGTLDTQPWRDMLIDERSESERKMEEMRKKENEEWLRKEAAGESPYEPNPEWEAFLFSEDENENKSRGD